MKLSVEKAKRSAAGVESAVRVAALIAETETLREASKKSQELADQQQTKLKSENSRLKKAEEASQAQAEAIAAPLRVENERLANAHKAATSELGRKEAALEEERKARLKAETQASVEASMRDAALSQDKAYRVLEAQKAEKGKQSEVEKLQLRIARLEAMLHEAASAAGADLAAADSAASPSVLTELAAFRSELGEREAELATRQQTLRARAAELLALSTRDDDDDDDDNVDFLAQADKRAAKENEITNLSATRQKALADAKEKESKRSEADKQSNKELASALRSTIKSDLKDVPRGNGKAALKSLAQSGGDSSDFTGELKNRDNASKVGITTTGAGFMVLPPPVPLNSVDVEALNRALDGALASSAMSIAAAMESAEQASRNMKLNKKKSNKQTATKHQVNDRSSEPALVDEDELTVRARRLSSSIWSAFGGTPEAVQEIVTMPDTVTEPSYMEDENDALAETASALPPDVVESRVLEELHAVAIARFPELKLVDAYRVLVHQLLQRGNAAEAVVALRAAIRISPRDAQLWYQLGAVLRESGHSQPALVAFNESRNWTLVLEAAIRGARTEQERKIAASSLHSLNMGNVLLAIADTYEDLNDIAGAVEALEQVVVADQNDPLVGTSFATSGEEGWEGQEEENEGVNSTSPAVLRRLGLGLLMMRKFSAAAVHLRAALVALHILRFEGDKAVPRGLREPGAPMPGVAGDDAVQLLHALGLCESEAGNYTAAAEALRSALSVDPRNVAVSLEIGRVYRLSGEPHRGIAPLQSVLKVNAPKFGIARGSTSAGSPLPRVKSLNRNNEEDDQELDPSVGLPADAYRSKYPLPLPGAEGKKKTSARKAAIAAAPQVESITSLVRFAFGTSEVQAQEFHKPMSTEGESQKTKKRRFDPRSFARNLVTEVSEDNVNVDDLLAKHLTGESLVEFGLSLLAVANTKGAGVKFKSVIGDGQDEVRVNSERAMRSAEAKGLRMTALDALRRAVPLLPLDRRAEALLPLGELCFLLGYFSESEACFSDAVVLCAASSETKVARLKREARTSARAKARQARKALKKAKQVSHRKRLEEEKQNDSLQMFSDSISNALVLTPSVTSAVVVKAPVVEQFSDEETESESESEEEEEEESSDRSMSVTQIADGAAAHIASLALPRAYIGLADALAAQGLHAAAATSLYACIGLRRLDTQVTPEMFPPLSLSCFIINL